MKQERLILLAGEMLDLHRDEKIDLNSWGTAKEFVEWFLAMKLEEN